MRRRQILHRRHRRIPLPTACRTSLRRSRRTSIRKGPPTERIRLIRPRTNPLTPPGKGRPCRRREGAETARPAGNRRQSIFSSFVLSLSAVTHRIRLRRSEKARRSGVESPEACGAADGLARKRRDMARDSIDRGQRKQAAPFVKALVDFLPGMRKLLRLAAVNVGRSADKRQTAPVG